RSHPITENLQDGGLLRCLCGSAGRPESFPERTGRSEQAAGQRRVTPAHGELGDGLEGIRRLPSGSDPPGQLEGRGESDLGGAPSPPPGGYAAEVRERLSNLALAPGSRQGFERLLIPRVRFLEVSAGKRDVPQRVQGDRDSLGASELPVDRKALCAPFPCFVQVVLEDRDRRQRSQASRHPNLVPKLA